MGSWGSGESGPMAPPGPPSIAHATPLPPNHGAPGTLTDVGGPFSHHVLVMVDAGIRDSGLGIVRRDHKEFLRRVGRCRVRTEKPLGWGWGVEPGLRDWGLSCFPSGPGDQNRAQRSACMRAKSLQSCPTLCNPMDGSPPGSSVHGILQARILEWVAKKAEQ